MGERRSFGQRRFGDRVPRFIPKPVEVGKAYAVDIVEKSRRGDGVARLEGLVIFVPNANPGQHVTVKITRISSRFAEAELAESEDVAGKETS